MYNIIFILSEQILFLLWSLSSDVVCATIATDVELKELMRMGCKIIYFCIFNLDLYGYLAVHLGLFFIKTDDKLGCYKTPKH